MFISVAILWNYLHYNTIDSHIYLYEWAQMWRINLFLATSSGKIIQNIVLCDENDHLFLVNTEVAEFKNSNSSAALENWEEKLI